MSICHRVNTILSSSLIGLAAFAIVSPSVHAQSPITLKVASPWPSHHPANVWGPEYFMKQVKKMTHGEVKFEWYPDGQLGSPSTSLQLLESGGIDMLLVTPPYTPSKLPLSQVGGLPGLGNSACGISDALQKITGPHGILTKNEYTPNNMHPLFAASPPPYEIMTTKKRVTRMSDLKGMRLKAAGGPESDALRALGAVPVQMDSTEVYQAVQRGILDGRIGPYASVPALHEAKIFHYGTIGASVGDFVAVFAINNNRWNKLPKNVQRAMTKASSEAVMKSCHFWDKSGRLERKKLHENDGWKFYRLTKSQQRRWKMKMAPVQQKWVQEMDKHGKAGRAVLAAFKQALKEHP